MNTYLVPTTAAYCYEPYDHFYLVYATTPLEAYQTAQRKQNISIIMKNVLYNIILVFLVKSLTLQLIYKAIVLFVGK